MVKRTIQQLSAFYQRHEFRVDMAFFVGGFLFDVVTLSGIDDALAIVQQVLYLAVIALLLGLDLLHAHGKVALPARMEKLWEARGFIIHFMLGSLLSVYSLFFFKSASILSSVVFVGLIMALMFANELKSVQGKGPAIKIALFVVCLFSFFSMLIPVLLGFVGWLPFLSAIALTLALLFLAIRWLTKRLEGPVFHILWTPSIVVLSLFFVLYLLGWVPPVPLALEEIGIYHQVERIPGGYRLKHQNPSWKFWNKGDQDFRARAGDKVFVFTRVFAPSRFNDELALRWERYDLGSGWVTSDRIRLKVVGGREEGHRGFAFKSNFTPGDWRVKVETSDGRELGRIALSISPDEERGEREWVIEQR